MYLLHIDHANNRLHLTLSGTFDERQAEKLRDELVVRIHDLSKGFHALCDASSLERFDRAARKHYRSFMDLCRESGVGKVVRIFPDPLDNFGLTVMSHFHYQGIPVVTCSNFEEALRHLTPKTTF